MRPIRRIVLVLLAVGALLGAPAAASASDWYIDGSIANDTGSEADNCFGASGVGCVTAGPGSVSLDDASHVVLPTSPIPSGDKGSFSFVAEGFWEGADMYARYTMPDQSTYEIVAEDDVGEGGTSGNYAACSQNVAQSSPYVCSAKWNGSEEEAHPAYTFGPSGQAPIASAGQICGGEMGGGDPVYINCNQTGQYGPIDSGNPMMLTFASLGSEGVYVRTSQGSNCRMYGVGRECKLFTFGAEDIEIGTLENSTRGSFQVEILGAADGPDAPDEMPSWPPADTAVGQAPKLSGLAISPAALSASYRDSSASTTVFTLERASPDGRRWTRVAARNVESSLTLAGTVRGRRCHRGRPDSTGTKACVWRRAIFGAFAHRDRIGRNTVSFARRLDGQALAPGLYRLTARARAHASTLISKPVSARFRIAR